MISSNQFICIKKTYLSIIVNTCYSTVNNNYQPHVSSLSLFWKYGQLEWIFLLHYHPLKNFDVAFVVPPFFPCIINSRITSYWLPVRETTCFLCVYHLISMIRTTKWGWNDLLIIHKLNFMLLLFLFVNPIELNNV